MRANSLFGQPIQFHAGKDVVEQHPPALDSSAELFTGGRCTAIQGNPFNQASMAKSQLLEQFFVRRGGSEYREPTTDHLSTVESVVSAFAKQVQLGTYFRDDPINGDKLELVTPNVTLLDSKVRTGQSERLYILCEITDQNANPLVVTRSLTGEPRLLPLGGPAVLSELEVDLDNLRAQLDSPAEEIAFNYRILYSPAALRAELEILTSPVFLTRALSDGPEASHLLSQCIYAACQSHGIDYLDGTGGRLSANQFSVAITGLKYEPVPTATLVVGIRDLRPVAVIIQTDKTVATLQEHRKPGSPAPEYLTPSLRDRVGVVLFNVL